MTAPVLLRSAVHRIACAIVTTELGRLPGTNRPSAIIGHLLARTPIGDEGLGLDSIEHLGAMAETFDLDDSLLGEDLPLTVGAWVYRILLAHIVGDEQMTVTTSGSTGSKRGYVHAVADLFDEAKFLATRFGGRRRVVALVPAHHSYGIIWTALLPDALGVPVVVRRVGAALGLPAGDLVLRCRISGNCGHA